MRTTQCDNTVLVQLEQVAIGYAGRSFLSGINVQIRCGETLAVVGPNGAGKSTLLFTMLGIIPLKAGKIHRRPNLVIGYVPQQGYHDPIFPLRAIDVVAAGGMGVYRSTFGVRIRFASKARALGILNDLGVAHLANIPFSELSGGQQQRMLVARALVRDPQLLVLDEPTAGMDLPSSQDLMDLVSALALTHQMGVVFVTHQLSLAARHASHIAIMNKDQGVFITDEAHELLTRDRLSPLYNREITVVEVDGLKFIRPSTKA